MPKYDYDGVSLCIPNTSPEAILKNIHPGSDVLEFGCATGYMTRYMKEELNCRVTIVEYDEESYRMAQSYADDGLCGDILDFAWYEKFQDKRYDAILFADVLEHLSQPDKVLSMAAKLLKNTGCIYISIPNITHNDVLLKAFGDRFDYTSLGLLDDTHVHFWGFQNLQDLAVRAGLKIQHITATYQKTGMTEQAPLAMNEMSPNANLLTRLLRQRRFGDVYQFILTMARSGVETMEEAFQSPYIVSHLYLDTGSGFNTQQILSLPGYSTQGNGIYQVHYELPATPELRRIRFDPIENEGCILRSLTIIQEGRVLAYQPVHGLIQEHGLLLPDSDPMVFVEDLSACAPIVLNAEIQLVGEEYLASLEQICRRFGEQEEELRLQKKNLERQQSELDALCIEIAHLQEQLARLHAHYADEKQKLVRKATELHQTNDVLSQENQRLKMELDAYSILLINKEKYILHLQNELSDVRKIRGFIKTNDVLSQENQRLKMELDAYSILLINKEKYILHLQNELSNVRKIRGFIKLKLCGIIRMTKHLVKQVLKH